MCCNVLDGGMLTDAGVGGRTSVIGKYGSCFDDDFMLYEFKISKCLLTQPHLWRDCPFVHPGEPVHRRHPSLYKGDLCPAVKQGQICPHGPGKCSHAHNAFEAWLHPEKYKTIMCRKGARCTRDICFFAHNPGELRVPSTPRPAPPADASTEALAAASHWVTGGTSQFPETAPVPLSVTPAGSPGLPASQTVCSRTSSVNSVGPAVTSMGAGVTMSGPSLMSALPVQQLAAVPQFTLQAPVTPVLTHGSAPSAVPAGGVAVSSGNMFQPPYNAQQKLRECDSPPMVSAATTGSCIKDDLDCSDRAIRTAMLRLQLQAALQGQPLPKRSVAKRVEPTYAAAPAASSIPDTLCGLDAGTYAQLLAGQQQQQQQTTLHAKSQIQQQQHINPSATSAYQQGLLSPALVPAANLPRNSCGTQVLTGTCRYAFAGLTAAGVQHTPAAPDMAFGTAATRPVLAVPSSMGSYFDDSAVALTGVPSSAYTGGFAGTPRVDTMSLLHLAGQQQQVAAHANTAIAGAHTPALGMDCRQLPTGAWFMAGLGI